MHIVLSEAKGVGVSGKEGGSKSRKPNRGPEK